MVKLKLPVDDYKVITQFWAENLGWDYTAAPFYYRGHNGIDFGVNTGSNVYAADDGVVYQTDFNEGGICINHSWGGTLYWHNSEFLVKVGDNVTRGQLIAKSGNKGKYTGGAHLHFSCWVHGDTDPTIGGYTDPLAYIFNEDGIEDGNGDQWRVEAPRKRYSSVDIPQRIVFKNPEGYGNVSGIVYFKWVEVPDRIVTGEALENLIPGTTYLVMGPKNKDGFTPFKDPKTGAQGLYKPL